MSTSPEAFHVLRCKCASTHALISICQYVLGIGDRHLSNFMINLKNGEMVGIDFGHAFGSATQVSIGLVSLLAFHIVYFEQDNTVHYLGGMNKSNEDTWVYILNMDEPGIKPNILNPTFYLQFLPIPELIPFRLTRQLRNLMMPLQVHGLMESTMIHTLRALRNNCDLLLNTMDIFVKEPSVDWLVSTHIYR